MHFTALLGDNGGISKSIITTLNNTGYIPCFIARILCSLRLELFLRRFIQI
ncbi:unnamed protein product [Thelazia callipaeda]|uniref:Uncharacterized protein n=1 Tax=Thelazia callipaeda TaxID=103827 RepID=A0A0N5CRW7_THECL|nr:unnamed protein product [Thelazia callipaeda]